MVPGLIHKLFLAVAGASNNLGLVLAVLFIEASDPFAGLESINKGHA